MVMIRKRAFLVLAVGVLMGTMAVAALADYPDKDLYEPADTSVSSQPEQGAAQPATEQIREAMETGAVPGESVKKEYGGWLYYQDVPPESVRKEYGGWLYYQDVPPQNSSRDL
jgi:hypothetical protein